MKFAKRRKWPSDVLKNGSRTCRDITLGIRVSKAGSPVTHVSASCVTNTYAYDGFARQAAVTDGRGNTSLTGYNAAGQVEYTEDAASNRTAYTYDELGRQASVSSPLSNTVFNAYDSLGNVIRTWGATYPVEYGYDTRGRKISMKTFRVENGNGDETRWLYDNVTGLLTNKVYAVGKGTAYGYWPDCRPRWTTWKPRDFVTNIKIGSAEDRQENRQALFEDTKSLSERLNHALEKLDRGTDGVANGG